MTTAQLAALKRLLAGRLLFPEARALASLMLKIHERRNGR